MPDAARHPPHQPAHAEENRRMFDSIAARYDLMNRVISLGLDTRWRRHAVRMLDPAPAARCLDVGTGTADMCIEILRIRPDARVVGVDPSERMLAEARARLQRAKMSANVILAQGEAGQLPFADASFDGVTAAFVLRNMDDHPRALAEMRRVLRPGGRLIVLELSVPPCPIMRLLHRAYSRTILPAAARILSERGAYRYLVRSVEAFPPAETVLEMLTQSGFQQPAAAPLSAGIVNIFSASV